MQNGMFVVKLDPGLQSLARATVAPASSNRRASGYGERVENSAAGSSVATVALEASRSMSASVRCVQWSAEAAPAATATLTPGQAELVGVGRRLEPSAGAGPEHCRGLVGVKGAPVAEHVYPLGQRGAALEHLRADEVDIVV